MGDDYHHGDLRRALLDAAERIVARDGAANASLRAIAREAGVSPAAPYHHFEDRESLLAGVAASGFESLRAALEDGAAAAEDPAPIGHLQAAGIAYVRFAVDHPQIYRLMFSGLLSDRSLYPELQAAADAAFGVLQALLGPGVPGGDRGGDDEDRSIPKVALATWSTVHGLATLLIEGLLEEESSWVGTEEITRQVTLVLGRGLKSFLGPTSD